MQFNKKFILFILLGISMPIIKPTFAKRGCAAFGHSCLGGHGKRSEGPRMPQEYEQGPMYYPRQQPNQETDVQEDMDALYAIIHGARKNAASIMLRDYIMSRRENYSYMKP